VLFARETLLLRGGHDFTVAEKRGRAIVEIGGETEDSRRGIPLKPPSIRSGLSIIARFNWEVV
jgi:hypothetical protein